MKFRPIKDWVLVKLDPIPKYSHGIELVHGGRVRTATVISTGPGKENEEGILQPIQVSKGEKIAFFREHLEHQQGKNLTSKLEDLGDGLGLLREMDILFIIPDGSEVMVTG